MSSVNTYFVTVGTSSKQIVGANCKRKALIFCGDNTNVFTVDYNTPVVLKNGLTIPTAPNAIQIDLDDFGATLQQPWYGIANNAGSLLTIYELTE